MSIGRNLLEQMALSGPAGAEFDEVVVALDKRNHAQEGNPSRALRKRLRLKADRAEQEADPFGCREGLDAP